MFKKITLAIVVSLFTTLASANDEYYYLKGGIGFNNINTSKFSNHDFEGRIKLSDCFPLIEAGIGFRFAEGIRIESVLEYYFLFRTSETSTNPEKDMFKLSAKTKADSLMFNAYKDVGVIGRFTPFIGGGIGVSQLQESVSGYVVSQEDGIHHTLANVPKRKFYRFTYKLTAGLNIKISEGVNSEISYNYFNLGNNKQQLIGGVDNIGNRSYAIHSLIFGIRVAI